MFPNDDQEGCTVSRCDPEIGEGDGEDEGEDAGEGAGCTNAEDVGVMDDGTPGKTSVEDGECCETGTRDVTKSQLLVGVTSTEVTTRPHGCCGDGGDCRSVGEGASPSDVTMRARPRILSTSPLETVTANHPMITVTKNALTHGYPDDDDSKEKKMFCLFPQTC